MYKVFVNEKVICFTNNQENCNQLSNQIVLTFFSETITPFLLGLLEGNGKIDVVIAVDDYKKAFSEFKNYFKIIKAAGGIVANNKDKQLFIYRLNKWDLPKGKIEKGEGIKKAALREIEEECGISDLIITEQLQNTYHVYRHKNKLILKVTYWFKLTSNFKGELIPQLEEGITKVEWLTDAEINDKVLKNTYASIKELL